jgi:hypothetical protein
VYSFADRGLGEDAAGSAQDTEIAAKKPLMVKYLYQLFLFIVLYVYK